MIRSGPLGIPKARNAWGRAWEESKCILFS
jgi:hypothetical protein